MGALSEPEHAVLTEYYDWMEENLDIGLDLIGKTTLGDRLLNGKSDFFFLFFSRSLLEDQSRSGLPADEVAQPARREGHFAGLHPIGPRPLREVAAGPRGRRVQLDARPGHQRQPEQRGSRPRLPGTPPAGPGPRRHPAAGHTILALDIPTLFLLSLLLLLFRTRSFGSNVSQSVWQKKI